MPPAPRCHLKAQARLPSARSGAQEGRGPGGREGLEETRRVEGRGVGKGIHWGLRREGGCERARRGPLGRRLLPREARPGRETEGAAGTRSGGQCISYSWASSPDRGKFLFEIPGATPASSRPNLPGAPPALETGVGVGSGSRRRCPNGSLEGGVRVYLQGRRAQSWRTPRVPGTEGTNWESRACWGPWAGHPGLAPPPAGQRASTQQEFGVHPVGARRKQEVRGRTGEAGQGLRQPLETRRWLLPPTSRPGLPAARALLARGGRLHFHAPPLSSPSRCPGMGDLRGGPPQLGRGWGGGADGSPPPSPLPPSYRTSFSFPSQTLRP